MRSSMSKKQEETHPLLFTVEAETNRLTSLEVCYDVGETSNFNNMTAETRNEAVSGES